MITIQRHIRNIYRQFRFQREVHPVIIILAHVFSFNNQANPVTRIIFHVFNSLIGIDFSRHQGPGGVNGLFVLVFHCRFFYTRLFSGRDGDHRILICRIRIRNKHAIRFVPFRGDIPGSIIVHQINLFQLEDLSANLVFHVHTSQHPSQRNRHYITRHKSLHYHFPVHG